MKHDTSVGMALQLAMWGYRRVSNSGRIVARVDRPDWKEFMAERHSPWDPKGEGMSWVNCLGRGAPDHYRRVYSPDTLTVRDDVFRLIPGSNWDPTEYVEKKE